MSIKDWIDIPALQGQSRHLTAVAGVLLSLFIISHLAKLLFGEGLLVTSLDYIDKFLAFVAILFYGGRLVYHLVKVEKGTGHANFSLVV